MKWSKLKTISESHLADSLRGKMFFYLTRYGKRDSYTMARAWITFEGAELVSFSEVAWLGERQSLASRILAKLEANENFAERGPSRLWTKAQAQATDALTEQGVHSTEQFLEALHTFMNLSIDEALIAEDPLLKSLALLDKRVGRRRLEEFSLEESASALVRRMYEIRCKAENIRPERKILA